MFANCNEGGSAKMRTEEYKCYVIQATEEFTEEDETILKQIYTFIKLYLKRKRRD